MSGKARAKPALDARFHNAVLLLLRCQGKLLVPEAMRACGFSAEDARDKNKQMWVNRAVKKAQNLSDGLTTYCSLSINCPRSRL